MAPISKQDFSLRRGHAMRFKLIENARTEFHRLWCIRTSLALGTFIGVASVTSAFVEVFNPWFLLIVAVVVNIAIIPLTRIVEQSKPGAPQ